MSRTKRFRVLIADDDPGVLRLLTEAFSDFGWDVDAVHSAEEVVVLAQELGSDLILLDLMMPGPDGFTTLARLRREPSFRDTPVVLMSGEPASVQAKIGIDLGATAYLQKPFTLDELRVFVERLMAGETT